MLLCLITTGSRGPLLAMAFTCLLLLLFPLIKRPKLLISLLVFIGLSGFFLPRYTDQLGYTNFSNSQGYKIISKSLEARVKANTIAPYLRLNAGESG